MLTLEQARNQLAAVTHPDRWNHSFLGSHLEVLASMFSKTGVDSRRELAAEFHNCAGKLPYIDDCDFGALVLEEAAQTVADTGLQKWLLTEALFRARWCAQGATAGGEAVSRSGHFSRIKAKLESLNEPS